MENRHPSIDSPRRDSIRRLWGCLVRNAGRRPSHVDARSCQGAAASWRWRGTSSRCSGTFKARSVVGPPTNNHQRLARELRIWARLDHPNILRLIGYYLSPDMVTAQLISPLAQHGHLGEYITRSKPSQEKRMELVNENRYVHTRVHLADRAVTRFWTSHVGSNTCTPFNHLSAIAISRRYVIRLIMITMRKWLTRFL